METKKKTIISGIKYVAIPFIVISIVVTFDYFRDGCISSFYFLPERCGENTKELLYGGWLFGVVGFIYLLKLLLDLRSINKD